MTVIYHDVEQGTYEWLQLKAGVISASNFSLARAKYKSGAEKGKPTGEARNLAFRLAVERISGDPLDEGYQPWQGRRGQELEEDARALHALTINMPVKKVGFVRTEDGKFGASADGAIGEDGGSEYKAFLAPEKLRGIIIDNDWGDIRDQVQGGLWLTGRKWWHIGLYCPALDVADKELIIHEEFRDEDYIEALEADLVEFDRLVEQYKDAILERQVSNFSVPMSQPAPRNSHPEHEEITF